MSGANIHQAAFDSFCNALASLDVDQVARHVAEDLEFVAPMGCLKKPHFLDIIAALFTAFPDVRFTSENIRPSDDGITAELRISGTHTGDLLLPTLGLGPITATGTVVSLPVQELRYTFQGDLVRRIEPRRMADVGLPGILRRLGVSGPSKTLRALYPSFVHLGIHGQENRWWMLYVFLLVNSILVLSCSTLIAVDRYLMLHALALSGFVLAGLLVNVCWLFMAPDYGAASNLYSDVAADTEQWFPPYIRTPLIERSAQRWLKSPLGTMGFASRLLPAVFILIYAGLFVLAWWLVRFASGASAANPGAAPAVVSVMGTRPSFAATEAFFATVALMSLISGLLVICDGCRRGARWGFWIQTCVGCMVVTASLVALAFLFYGVILSGGLTGA